MPLPWEAEFCRWLVFGVRFSKNQDGKFTSHLLYAGDNLRYAMDTFDAAHIRGTSEEAYSSVRLVDTNILAHKY